MFAISTPNVAVEKSFRQGCSPTTKRLVTREWQWAIAFPDTEQLCAVLAKGLPPAFLLLCCGGPSGYSGSRHVNRNKRSRR
jgi:hypothetical protein